MNGSKSRQSSHFLWCVLLFAFLLGACASNDLDITPTLAPTDVPTAEPSPTPQTAAEVEAAAEDEVLLDAIIAAMPNQLPAGAVIWRRDFTSGTDGVEIPRNVQGGTAKKVFYTEQVGGKTNITYGIFESAEAAKSHFDFIQGIRPVLENGKQDDAFPQPNLFSSGLYGSIAIFQIDRVFIEVNIEVFSSTAGNPLPALSRAVLAHYETVAGAGE